MRVCGAGVHASKARHPEAHSHTHSTPRQRDIYVISSTQGFTYDPVASCFPVQFLQHFFSSHSSLTSGLVYSVYKVAQTHARVQFFTRRHSVNVISVDILFFRESRILKRANFFSFRREIIPSSTGVIFLLLLSKWLELMPKFS